MCIHCSKLTRRGFLGAMAATAGAALIGGPARAADLTPDAALAKLKAGNAKYLAGPQVCVADLMKAREAVLRIVV